MSVATMTFNVRMMAKIANVRVERVTCEDMSVGDICPTPFAPFILINTCLNARIIIGRLTATNSTEPTIISIMPTIRISIGMPLTSVIHLPMASTNRMAGIR